MRLGEKELFCGDPALQLSPNEIDLQGAKPVLCTKTAIEACEAIVTEGEGAKRRKSNARTIAASAPFATNTTR